MVPSSSRPPSKVHRTSVQQVCAAKGFGTPKKQNHSRLDSQEKSGIDGSAPQGQAVKQALRAAGAVRPIDPQEAARGRLDMATVKDWGSGDPGQLGELQVTGMKTRFDPSADRPLSVQLALLLEQLEAQGSMRLADGGQPLPPFDRWSFTRERYLQYLADMAEVHLALERAVMGLTEGSNEGGTGVARLGTQVQLALRLLGPSCGLYRGQQLQHDLEVLHSATSSGAAGASGSQSNKSGTGSIATVAAGGSSKAFAAYISQLATAAQSPAASPDECDRAALRLLACAYSLLASFHSSGTQVGAMAAERSGAAAASALSCYTDYPGLTGDGASNPAVALVSKVDAAGAALTIPQRQVVFEELPRCFAKAALLIAALAFED